MRTDAPTLPTLDYGVADGPDMTGFADGRRALYLTIGSPVALLLYIFSPLWFVAIVWYGVWAVWRTRGQSVPGWIGLIYGSAVLVAIASATIYLMWTGR